MRGKTNQIPSSNVALLQQYLAMTTLQSWAMSPTGWIVLPFRSIYNIKAVWSSGKTNGNVFLSNRLYSDCHSKSLLVHFSRITSIDRKSISTYADAISIIFSSFAHHDQSLTKNDFQVQLSRDILIINKTIMHHFDFHFIAVWWAELIWSWKDKLLLAVCWKYSSEFRVEIF